ncbi:MAG: F0F1 ATP synthase subunit delta [Burkholderiaceae bacterium]|jgi:F-type H+-transporting ATPase subunit delta|nr:F0F1 ATP synthase subunit delta [Burkholderiaceae bacterium]
MAELATIARPYAEALFKAAGGAEAQGLVDQLAALAAVAADPTLRQFADSPKVSDKLVFNVFADVLARQGVTLLPAVANLLRTVLDNGRLPALGEIIAQYRALVDARSGMSRAIVYSAFPIDGAQLGDVVAALESRFGRRLDARVEVDPELIGGIRAVVGDEVYDASVKARLEQMKVALTA